MEFVDYFNETKAYLSWIGSILVVVKVFISTYSSNSTCDKFRKVVSVCGMITTNDVSSICTFCFANQNNPTLVICFDKYTNVSILNRSRRTLFTPKVWM